MRAGKMHHGVDFFAPMAAPVHAVLGGTVTHATVNGAPGFSNLGHTVVIRHDSPRVWTLYAHLAAEAVRPGQRVERGQLLGWTGNTRGSYDSKRGKSVPAFFRSSKPHTHFEVRTIPLPSAAGPGNLEPIAFLAAHGLSYPTALPSSTPSQTVAPGLPVVEIVAPSSSAAAPIAALAVGLGLALALGRRG